MVTRGKREAPAVRRPFGVADAVCIFLGAALLALLLAAAVLPRVLGLTAYAVSSESMSPALRRGDVLFVEAVGLDRVAPGDIVTFRTETGVLTHRVYEIAPDGALRTKADNADRLDAVPVTEENFLGRAVYKLPLLGYLSLGDRGEEGTA